MAKGIVIIDIPNCCGGCSLIDIDEDMNLYCGSTSLYIDINKLQSKPDWCPIRQIPEKRPEKDYSPIQDNHYFDGYDDGWNDCLNNILKED